MDVGVWGGGDPSEPKTSFGLISGTHIALCSWLNYEESGTSFRGIDRSNPVLSGMSAKMGNFVDEVSSLGRGALLSVACVDTPVNQPDDLLVIIPDLHLHAYENFDRFRYVDRETGENKSLDEELHMLINTCESVVPAITVQVGDLYEVWEVEMFDRVMFRNSVNEGEQQTDRFRPTTRDLCIRIQQAHSELFHRRSTLFNYEIRGNHDNFLSNQYWGTSSPHYQLVGDRHPLEFESGGGRHLFDDQLYANTMPYNQRNNYYLKDETGGKAWIEHGHKYDWHNNNEDWWRAPESAMRRRGFDTVFQSMFGLYRNVREFINLILRENDIYNITDSDARAMADSVTDYGDYEMRLPELRRAWEIIQSHSDVRLVVMGHTHSPALIEIGSRNLHLGEYNTDGKGIDQVITIWMITLISALEIDWSIRVMKPALRCPHSLPWAPKRNRILIKCRP